MKLHDVSPGAQKPLEVSPLVAGVLTPILLGQQKVRRKGSFVAFDLMHHGREICSFHGKPEEDTPVVIT